RPILEPWIIQHDLGGHGPNPVQQRLPAPLSQQSGRGRKGNLARLLPVLALHRKRECLLPLVAGNQYFDGTCQQRPSFTFREGFCETLPQEVTKKIVVLIAWLICPATIGEQLSAAQPIEKDRCPSVGANALGHLSSERIEDRGPEQDFAVFGRRGVEYLSSEVVEHRLP